jgi:hypothetical protein
MPATIDTRKAHLVRHHGDISAIFSWVNEERAMVLVPNRRPGAPWYVVMDSAAYTWDDSVPGNVATVARKASKACEVLGLEPTPTNCRRIAGIVIDGIPDLVRMPSAPPPEYLRGAIGQMILKEAGKTIAGEDIRVEKEGASYA